jgi:dTDP-4-dehydrorhamnose reductase
MKILLLGCQGQVGWELQRALAPLGPLVALDRVQADLERPMEPVVQEHQPDVIVNAAAYTAVDQAEAEPQRAWRINAEAVGELAQAAARRGALLVHYSTDYVFDGTGEHAYREDDPTGPLNTYGRSKLGGEEAIRAVPGCRHLIFRTSWVYARRGRNFARTILQRAQTQDSLRVIADTWGAPTSAELIADVTALAVHRAGAGSVSGGLFHLVPAGETTWHGYATYLLECARTAGMPLRVAPEAIEPVPADTFPAAARRPRNSRLDRHRLEAQLGLALPDWRWHLRRWVEELGG